MVKYDAVIVGAGILGLSTAYHIKNENPNTQILVIDKFGAGGQGNTAKSACGFRCLFTSSTNFLLADSSVEFYRHIQNDLEVDLKMRFIGYLVLLPEEEYKKYIQF